MAQCTPALAVVGPSPVCTDVVHSTWSAGLDTCKKSCSAREVGVDENALDIFQSSNAFIEVGQRVRCLSENGIHSLRFC